MYQEVEKFVFQVRAQMLRQLNFFLLYFLTIFFQLIFLNYLIFIVLIRYKSVSPSSRSLSAPWGAKAKSFVTAKLTFTAARRSLINNVRIFLEINISQNLKVVFKEQTWPGLASASASRFSSSPLLSWSFLELPLLLPWHEPFQANPVADHLLCLRRLGCSPSPFLPPPSHFLSPL